MKDEKIIELFFARDEKALEAVSEKFGKLCRFVASNFLCMREDREECFNDTLLALWNSIPPERPENLPAYVSATARNQAVNRSRAANAWKRGGQVQFVNEECLSLIADGKTLADDYESALAARILNSFIEELGAAERRVFVLRYWFDASILQIAKQTGFSESKVKSMLARQRRRLAQKLEKEGIIV